ncbi:beta-galactosidase [Staphylotrichum tortipilum]|uniref:beta-galactosidase n=1 Tax=Staphylotrichum tortipilum TaxID=2831512 RepID=A0AAN6RVD1_9PEZI|nr:beta-galactosidase [Staphylotrichum longicolle]
MAYSNCWSARLITWILLTLSFALGTVADTPPWPVHDNGLQELIQWDHYSLLINGQRLFLFGGEMHPFRLPVPELWEDILQKMKAMGLRMVSMYIHWGFHAPTPDTIDFTTGPHNLTRFFKLAKAIGLYVMVRPGPYINGELSAGGMALWATTGAYSPLRLNGTTYTNAWTPYQDAVAQATRPFQLTTNGTVILYQIENEFGSQWRDTTTKIPNPEAISYMEKLKANARRNGITVPLTHNMPNQNAKSWSADYDTVHAGGNVDIYGLDSYPQCWSCDTTVCGNASTTPWPLPSYLPHFLSTSPTQPPFIPEFQGGALNPWTGPPGGCSSRFGAAFANVYYRYAISQRVGMLNLYMLYGGTNWGWLAAPQLGSSYDYAAAIGEDRGLGEKYFEGKSLGLFLRVAGGEIAGAERVGEGGEGVYTNSTRVGVVELRNNDTGTRFYVVRQNEAGGAKEEWFAMRVQTKVGEFWVPRVGSAVVMRGDEAKVLVVDWEFAGEMLYYATAEVLTYSVVDGRPVLVLWTPRGRSGEFYLRAATSGRIVAGPPVTIVSQEHGMAVAYIQKEDMTVLEFDNGVRIVLVDRETAYRVWVPALTNNPTVPVDQTVIVIGPHLVRSATLLDATTLSLQGDTNLTAPTALKVFISGNVTHLLWNGVALSTTQTNYSTLLATIPSPHPPFPNNQPLEIHSWKSTDALPERSPSYPDTSPAWIAADDLTTPNPSIHPNTSTAHPFLFADQYGFHTGMRLWRGRFSSPNATTTGVFLSVQGGTAHAWSAYLNGVFLGSWAGDARAAVGNATLAFPEGVVKEKGNVLLVVHDDMGHDEQGGAVNVRGVLNATLLGKGGAGFDGGWKVAGAATVREEGKKEGTALDPVRTVYNEGGLVAERLGWHLPGFDDSGWGGGKGDGPREGFKGAGVRFYRGRLPLDVPKGVDVSLEFRFKPVDVDKKALEYRVLLFVNGWQYGRYYPSIAAEDTFPVPVGVLDYGGDNVVCLAVWALHEGGARVDIDVVVRYAVGSSLNVRFDGSYLRPGWGSAREAYL